MEPEWFTDGPKHQWDTIELGGFETISKKERSESSKSPSDENDDNLQQSRPNNSRSNDLADGSNQKFASGQKSMESRKTVKPKRESNKVSEDKAMNRATGKDEGAEKKKAEIDAKNAAGEQ